MPAEFTNKLRDLLSTEIDIISKEIQSVDQNLWIKHFKKFGPQVQLRDGESIHLNWPVKDLYSIMPTRPQYFPNVMNIIHSTVPPEQCGRIYIHRLKPGDSILKHHDQINISSMNIINRYHIYLAIPNPCQLILDNRSVLNPEIYANSIVDFSLQNLHAYKNDSNDFWYFVVFDKINKPNNLIN